MTGIFFYKAKKRQIPKGLNKKSRLIKHRGELEIFTKDDDFFLKVFINKAQLGNSKIFYKTGGEQGIAYVVIDGQITNMDELNQIISSDFKDIDPGLSIIKLIEKEGYDAFKLIKGHYTILVYSNEEIIAVKDPIGHNPLYILDDDELILISSELKVFKEYDDKPFILNPGTLYHYKNETFTIHNFYKIDAIEKKNGDDEKLDFYKVKLFKLLDKAVENSIQENHKFSALLSGGIDSSIVCALAARYTENVDVYTVYSEGSGDFEHSELLVKQYNDSFNHHVHEITLDDMLKMLPDVIYHLETFDAALIRSALPMYYICSKIKEKKEILLTGEGADELFGGYDYLKNFENLNQELVEMLKIEHATGLQRVDRIPYAYGIEARAPWFDLDIVEFSFQIPPTMKIREVNGRKVEKWIIRETFKHILPNEITWRDKAKFSKGVGSQFLLRNYINDIISREQFESEKEVFPGIFLKSKEELYYWNIFEKLFNPNENLIHNLPRTGDFII